ncbi:ECF RNA polymerase sigma factor SigL [compost metagenome]
MKVEEDINLVERFRNGDEIAVRKLYEIHYRPLCYFNQKIVHQMQEAEDISTEIFLKLLHKKNDFDSLQEIKSFLFTASKNACIDFLRKEKQQQKSNDQISFIADIDENLIEQELLTAKVLQAIYAEIESLPKQCKQVFKAIFIEGKSTAAIAEEMGLSPQTVLNQKAKALQIIRSAVSQEDVFVSLLFVELMLSTFFKNESGL